MIELTPERLSDMVQREQLRQAQERIDGMQTEIDALRADRQRIIAIANATGTLIREIGELVTAIRERKEDGNRPGQINTELSIAIMRGASSQIKEALDVLLPEVVPNAKDQADRR